MNLKISITGAGTKASLSSALHTLAEMVEKIPTSELPFAATGTVLTTEIEEVTEDEEEGERVIGTLTIQYGLRGYKPAPIGSNVWASRDRYLIYLEPLNGGEGHAIPFYKETLAPYINFKNPQS